MFNPAGTARAMTPYCAEHERLLCPMRHDRRPSASQRGYGAQWRRVRAEHLEMEPDCRSCGAPAREVDHIVTRRSGGSDDHDNLRSLCKPCHSRRTAIEQSGWGG